MLIGNLCGSSVVPYHADAIQIIGFTHPSNANYTSQNLVTNDTRFGVFSFWAQNVTGRMHNLIQTLTGDFWSIDGTGGVGIGGSTFNIDFWDTTNSKHIDFRFTIGGSVAWHHYLISVDTNHPAGQKIAKASIDGVPVAVTITSDVSAAFNIGWSEDATNTILGINPTRLPNDGQRWNMADFWWTTKEYVDATDPAVIAKFIDGDGKPVYLGANGELPTGTIPTVFFSGNAANFGTNLGTGGPFTKIVNGSGSIIDATTSPSD
jgi:hypothetical protein